MSTPNPFNFPVIMGSSGAQPTPPATIRNQLIAQVASQVPDYTSNLPASLIEDVSSTEVAGISAFDQGRVDFINSLTPFGVNAFLLQQLANVYGLTLGIPTNTSVLVVFSGTVGFVINNGFLVGDGTNVYQIQGGGPIGSGGTSSSLTAVAVNNTSAFAVPANTVTQLLTSFPSTVTLSVNNPTAGTPASATETLQSFRTRVLQAGLAASVGTTRYIKTLIGNVLGANSNLVSVQTASGGLRVVVGGSLDQYQVAYAIWQSVADISTLQTHAHAGSDVSTSLIDYPDTYVVKYVAAAAQPVTMTATWNTVLTSFTGGAAFPQLVQAPLAAYFNALGIGGPINLIELTEIFQNAVENVLDVQYLTRLVFSVNVNGSSVSPGAGESFIAIDPEAYLTCLPSAITVVQG